MVQFPRDVRWYVFAVVYFASIKLNVAALKPGRDRGMAGGLP